MDLIQEMVEAGYDLGPMDIRAVESKAELEGTYLKSRYLPRT